MSEPFEVSDDRLLLRAVANSRCRRISEAVEHPRWVAVMDTFAVGSTYARLLCHRFGYNPDELVKR